MNFFMRYCSSQNYCLNEYYFVSPLISDTIDISLKKQDHGLNAKHLILLVPEEPDMGWKGLLLRYSANDRVTYIRGDPRQAIIYSNS